MWRNTTTGGFDNGQCNVLIWGKINRGERQEGRGGATHVFHNSDVSRFTECLWSSRGENGQAISMTCYMLAFGGAFFCKAEAPVAQASPRWVLMQEIISTLLTLYRPLRNTRNVTQWPQHCVVTAWFFHLFVYRDLAPERNNYCYDKWTESVRGAVELSFDVIWTGVGRVENERTARVFQQWRMLEVSG